VEPGSTEASTAVDADPVDPGRENLVSTAEANANGWVIGTGIAATVAALALLVLIRRSSRSSNRR